MKQPVQAIPLEYAQDESLPWRSVARGVATVIVIYAIARLLASVVQAASYVFVQGVGMVGFLPYAMESIAIAVPLAGVLIACLNYTTSGKGRVAIIWALVAYIVIRAGMTAVMVTIAAVSYTSAARSPSGGYLVASYVSRVFAAGADCVWPAVGIWFFNRPPLRQRS